MHYISRLIHFCHKNVRKQSSAIFCTPRYSQIRVYDCTLFKHQRGTAVLKMDRGVINRQPSSRRTLSQDQVISSSMPASKFDFAQPEAGLDEGMRLTSGHCQEMQIPYPLRHLV
jgi:hypothetical protein